MKEPHAPIVPLPPPSSLAPDDQPSKPQSKCPDRFMVDGESKPAWEALKAYYELGNSRSIPQLVNKLGKSRSLLDKWSKQWRWNERIEEATNEARAIWRAAQQKKSEEFQEELHQQRMIIARGNFEIAQLAQKRAMEILELFQVQDVQGKGGDGSPGIIKANPNIRIVDAARLGIAANTMMQQADGVANPHKPGKLGQKVDGSPICTPESPMLEIYLDTGDGKPASLQLMPPVDELDPDFHPDSDDSEVAVRVTSESIEAT